MAKSPLKPLLWGQINTAHTPQLTLLCCEQMQLAPPSWSTHDFKVPYWRMYWNDRAGACLLAPDGIRHALKPTHCILVAPNTTLSQELSRPVKHFYTHFTVGLPFARIHNRVHRFAAHPLLRDAMRCVYPGGKQNAATHAAHRTATALELCWHALASLPADCLPADNDHPRLHDLLRWWETHDWRPVTNRVLAARLGMHPNAFCRHFQHALGVPPQIFGQIRRIDRACLLLHFSPLSIKQIAEAVGFCDRYYFSYKFRKLRGISPATFRRQFIAGAPGPESHA